MAVARVKVWIAGEVLTASDLNAEFNNLIDNALTLVSPWTANMDAGGFRLITLGAGTVGSPTLQPTGDTNTGVYFPAADQVSLAGGGVQILQASAYVSAVNFLRVVPSQTGAPVQVQAAGTDTNITLQLVPAGTGYVQFPIGTAANPALAFGTDLNTGFYGSTSELNVTVNGAQQILVGGGTVQFVRPNHGFEIGALATSNTPFIDFHSSGLSTDFDTRLIASAGSGDSGLGTLTVEAQALVATGYATFGAVTGTPAQHGLYRENVPKAWVSMSGTTAAINDSFNVSSTGDDATGLFTVVLDRDFATNYTIHGTCSEQRRIVNVARSSTASFQVLIDSTSALADVATLYLCCFGDQ